MLRIRRKKDNTIGLNNDNFDWRTGKRQSNSLKRHILVLEERLFSKRNIKVKIIFFSFFCTEIIDATNKISFPK